MVSYTREQIKSLNEDIKNLNELYPEAQLFEANLDMHLTHAGVSRLVFMDRYTFKDLTKYTIKENDVVVLTVKNDPQFPARGIGVIKDINHVTGQATVQVEDEYAASIPPEEKNDDNHVVRSLNDIDKPMELFYEQTCKRVAKGLADMEPDPTMREIAFQEFYHELVNMNIVPAGRVLYGAGSGADVTYFNCYVLPMPHDSRGGISDHRKLAQEIMSRGGGVGTNASTLRPRNSLARGVNGKSSGSVSWMNDIANLTNLIEQGGSRRGAQMLMLSDWHPDVLEFIISKMQNPRILRFIIENIDDPQIKQLAKDKLKFNPLSKEEREVLENYVNHYEQDNDYVNELLLHGGRYSVHNPDFLTGANISVLITRELMQAVENDTDYELRFPDVDSYDEEQMKYYNENWQECGDVREWENDHGMPVKTYRTIKAKQLWDLINICATYSAEPGIFFIDTANEATNARSYGQKVVATNPCGEQPLAPYSVCNLLAINLSNFVNKETKEVDYEKLRNTVRVAVRMGDNVISATPYFLEENKKQALGERRIGLGVMGLHDMLIHAEEIYGSESGNAVVEEVFETIAVKAYETSIDIAGEKGSFGFMQNEDGSVNMDVAQEFVKSGFMSGMPEHIRGGVLENGIRNSHLLTVAPTGSTGTMIGCSTGLEPYFSFSYFRSGRLGKSIEVKAKIVQDYLDANPDADPDNLPPWFVSAMELSPEAHADVQCIIQRWIDSSISKTVNAPRGYAVEQVQEVYERLYRGGAKGGTVYVDGSRDAQVLSLTKDDAPSETKAEKPKVFVTETIKPLKQTSVTIGSEIGNTCPVCENGTIIESGGCSTCNNCNAQLKCGL